MNVTRYFDLAPGEAVACKAKTWHATISVQEITPNGEVIIGIEGTGDLVVQVSSKLMELSGAPKCKGLPRVLLLFSLILSRSTRQDLFQPAFNEFLEDYVFARKRYKTRWAKRWLAFAFAVRTVHLIASCLGIQVGSCLSSIAQAVTRALSSWWSR